MCRDDTIDEWGRFAPVVSSAGRRVLGVVGKVDRYLVLILLTVGLASLLPARGTAAEVVADVSDVAIGLLFFLYGARLSTSAALQGVKQWRLHLTVLASTFVLFPLIGLAARVLQPSVLPHSLYFGVMFLCVLPSTVQSSIAFTSIARGNVAAAIVSASFSNLAGIVLTPVLAAVFLGSSVHVSPGSIVRIALQLLAPFVAGQICRRWIGDALTRHKRLTGVVDRGSVLLVVYGAFSAGMVAHIWSHVSVGQILLVVLVNVVILAIVLTATNRVGSWLRFERGDRLVLLFCGSKKSIATGIPMAAVLFSHADVSLIVLPAMIFHQIQLMVCAVLSRRYAREYELLAPAAGTAVPAPV